MWRMSLTGTMVACYRTAEAEPPEVDGTRLVPPIAARRPTSKRAGLVHGNGPPLPALATRFHRIHLSPTSPVHHKVALLTLTHVYLYRPVSIRRWVGVRNAYIIHNSRMPGLRLNLQTQHPRRASSIGTG